MSSPASTTLAPYPGDAPQRRRTFAGDVWVQFKSHRGGVLGAIVILLILLVVVVGPSIHGVDPQALNPRDKNQGVSFAHPMGTDNLGRDLFAQVLAGGRMSLSVGLIAMLISLVIGSLIGTLAGFFRKLDGPLMRLADLFLALPLLPLLLVVIMLFRETLRAAFGPEMGIFLLIVAIMGVTSWMQTARVVRGAVLSVKEQDFVLAARSIGTREWRIVLRHILPNVLSPIMVSATLGIATAIITESALSFLGLGFPSDYPTWGRLLYDGVNFMQINPSRVIWPGLAISLTVLSINYIGDALRDAFDPRIRGR